MGNFFLKALILPDFTVILYNNSRIYGVIIWKFKL